MEKIKGRVSADFNSSDPWERYRLVNGSFKDIEKLGLTLEDGLWFTIYQDDDDFEVNARLQFSLEEKVWVFIPDWSTRKDLSSDS